MTPLVLVHGGGFDSRCWDLLIPNLGGAALAVNLPGRADQPAALQSVTLVSCADSVIGQVNRAGFDDVILVGHSLAGCSIPSIADRLGRRVQHIVFIAATVPPNGKSAFDTLDPEIQALITAAADNPAPAVMDGALAKLVLGDDLDDEQLAWCVERLVPEALRLTTDPVDVTGLKGVPCTWIRTTRDLIVAPEKQLEFAAEIEGCRIVDIDAGHMCMVSQPAEVATILAGITE